MREGTRSPEGGPGAATAVRLPALPWGLPAALGLFAAWILLSLGSLAFERWPGGSAWYPPAALVAAACVVWGGRALLPLLLGSLAMAEVSGHPGESLARLLVLSALLKGAYWLGGAALRRLRFDPSFAQPSDVAKFGAVMAASGLLAALCGVTEAVLQGFVPRAQAARSVVIFWAGDAVAVLALTPVLLAGARLLGRVHGVLARRLSRPLRAPRLETVLQILSAPAALLFAFVASARLGALAYGACFLPLGWVALSRGVAGAALMSAALDVGAIVTRQWAGRAGDNLELQTFIALLALNALVLGSVAGQRERARRLHAQEEERYRALVELLPDPLLVHRNGSILFANAAAARLLGQPTAALVVGQPLSELAGPEFERQIGEQLGLAAAGKPVSLVEHRLRRADGEGPVEVESVSIPIPYEAEPALLTLARDITLRKRLAEELRHAQRLESVGRLAGGVAHDFNNMLSVVLTCGELIRAGTLPGAAEHGYAKEILEAAQRAAALTRQLLTFSRKEAQAPQPLRLDELVHGARPLLLRLIGPQVALRCACEDAGVVEAEPGQLEQALVNLALNARDAMPEGGELFVETRRWSSAGAEARWPGLLPGDYAMLLVRDTGTGMNEEVRRHVFDPFFTTKPPGKGTGLGLSTVHGIVRQARGFIFVDSEPGKGSRFTVFLPLVEDQPVERERPADPAKPAAPRALRVLLVEDDEAVRRSMRRLLESQGHAVIEAGHGRAALERLEAGAHVDLVLSDVTMPEMDGRQLARELALRGLRIPLLLVSGRADSEAGDDGLKILPKPLDGATLAAAIADALR